MTRLFYQWRWQPPLHCWVAIAEVLTSQCGPCSQIRRRLSPRKRRKKSRVWFLNTTLRLFFTKSNTKFSLNFCNVSFSRFVFYLPSCVSLGVADSWNVLNTKYSAVATEKPLTFKGKGICASSIQNKCLFWHLNIDLLKLIYTTTHLWHLVIKHSKCSLMILGIFYGSA